MNLAVYNVIFYIIVITSMLKKKIKIDLNLHNLYNDTINNLPTKELTP